MEMKNKRGERAIAFGATTAASTLLTSTFQLYYIDIFLNVYGITPRAFYLGQTLYMLWNAVNDPLFGYLQDSASSSRSAFGRKIGAIQIGGPLFALSSLLAWFPWSSESLPGVVVGIHFVVTLLVFDGLFTWVMLAHCALFAEIETDEGARTDVLATSQVAALVGAVLSALSNVFWERERLQAFQMFAVCAAAITAWVFYSSGKTLALDGGCGGVASGGRSSLLVDDDDDIGGRAGDDGGGGGGGGGIRALLKPSREIVMKLNFVAFVCMNFLQIFHTTFCANFFSSFAAVLVAPSLGAAPVSISLGLSTVLPQILNIAVLIPWMRRLPGGSTQLITRMFWIKVALSVFFAAVASTESAATICLFMVINRALAEATFSQFNMSVSLLIDDDLMTHRRAERLGSLHFGLNALFTKPAQSIAPMLVVAMLPSSPGGVDFSEEEEGPLLGRAQLRLLWAIPLICGTLQLIVWRRFALR